MHEQRWMKSLRSAVEDARSAWVRDSAIRERLDEILTDRAPPPDDKWPANVAGIVEIDIIEPDDRKQLPVRLSIPIPTRDNRRQT